MKNLTNLRNNKMNLNLRSILASSLIALTMISCTKENIEPASVTTFENARKRPNMTTDANATRTTLESADNNAQALIDIRIDETIDQPAARIIISRYADVIIIGERENQFSEAKMNPVTFNELLNFVETFNNTDQAFTANNPSSINIRQVEYRSCSNCDISTFDSRGNDQERSGMGTFIQELDKIVDLQSLLHMHHTNNAQK